MSAGEAEKWKYITNMGRNRLLYLYYVIFEHDRESSEQWLVGRKGISLRLAMPYKCWGREECVPITKVSLEIHQLSISYRQCSTCVSIKILLIDHESIKLHTSHEVFSSKKVKQ